MKTFFVTGASGNLGSCFIPLLLNAGYRLNLLRHRRSAAFEHPLVKWYSGDVCNPISCREAIQSADGVIHMAAITYSGCNQEYMQVNMEGTRSLVQECQDQNVRRFVFISTCAAGNDGGGYSRSKYLAEKAVMATNLDWTIVRPAEIYGMQTRNGIDGMIQAVHKHAIVVIPGAGEFTLAPVHISDVVMGLHRILESPMSSKQIYTLAGPQIYRYGDFVDEVLRLSHQKKIKIVISIRILKQMIKIGRICLPRFPFYEDQILRLVVPKDYGITLAQNDLQFYPKAFYEVFQSGCV